jgi:pilus assembly protein CpaE
MSQPLILNDPIEPQGEPSPVKGSGHLVLAALASPERLADLAPACGQLTDLTHLSPSEIIGAHGAGLVLVEAGIEGYEQIILSLAVERPNTAVILIGDQMPGHIVRALMKLEASDVLPFSAETKDILNAANRLGEELGGGDTDSVSTCWAFRGAVGGAGVTTLAIESAFDLAARVGPDKVCLVDLNVADGMTASFLEGGAKLDLEALSKAPERLDSRLLDAWCWKHEDGVSLITSPRNPDADVLATEAAILRLLDVACTVFDHVIVDMPRHRMPWTQSILAAVDQAVIVSELTVPSLHAAADAARETDAVRSGRDKTKLVLNRMFPKKRFRAEFAVDQAERAIERSIDATITSDWDAARTAVNLGQPIASVKEKSQLVADIATLVDVLLPEALAESIAAQSGQRRRA